MTNVLIVDDERIVQELFTYYIEKTDGNIHLPVQLRMQPMLRYTVQAVRWI